MNAKIRFLRLALLLAIPATFAASPSGVSPSSPNIVLIFTDDQGYQDIGCFGSTLHRSFQRSGLLRPTFALQVLGYPTISVAGILQANLLHTLD